MKHPVGATQDGTEVYAFLTGSKVGIRLAWQPQLLTLAKELLATVTLRGADTVVEYDMQRQIGYDYVIGTTDTDTVFYACLVKDEVFTRFVKNRKPTPTNYLTIIARRDAENSYELTDIYIGRYVPPRPGSTDETDASRPYWARHAVILSNQPVQAHSLTKLCPY